MAVPCLARACESGQGMRQTGAHGCLFSHPVISMLPFHLLPDPVALAVRLINPLIRREPWAAQRLRAHAGKVVWFDVGLPQFGLQILPEGTLQSAARDSVPNVTLSVPASRWREIPAVLRERDPAALAGLMHIQGDAALAQVVSDLARDLRWDVEDDLSRVVGDVAAVRMVSTARSVASAAQEGAKRFMGNTAEYLSEESDMLVSKPAFQHWADGVAALDSRLSGIEQRLARLSRRRSPNPGKPQRPAGPVNKS